MSKTIIDKIVTRGLESSKQINYELWSKGKFAGSNEFRYSGITEAQIQAHKHIDTFPDVYEISKKCEFFHYNS